jgi:hypothetical protein
MDNSKAKLWRRVARLAGELMFTPQHTVPLGTAQCHAPQAVRALIRDVRSFDEVDPLDKKHHERIIAKLEAALAAWEAAK